CRLHQIDAIKRETGGGWQILLSPSLEIGARAGRMLVGLGMARERRSKRLNRRVEIPAAIGIGGAGFGDFLAQAAQLRVLAPFEAADLLLNGADAGHLANVGGHAPKEKVARHIE